MIKDKIRDKFEKFRYRRKVIHKYKVKDGMVVPDSVIILPYDRLAPESVQNFIDRYIIRFMIGAVLVVSVIGLAAIVASMLY